MNRIQIRRLVSVLAALAAALAAAVMGGPVAFAQPHPPFGPGARPRHPIPFPPHTHTTAAGAAVGWQVVLILAGAAILGAAVAVLISRARGARRRLPVPAA
jgi:hypothetical protein